MYLQLSGSKNSKISGERFPISIAVVASLCSRRKRPDNMKSSIPVVTACAGVEIGKKKLAVGEEVPSINLSLNISIPVRELLAALSSSPLAQTSTPPPPDQVPDCFVNKALAKQLPSAPSASQNIPSGRWEAMPTAMEAVPRSLPAAGAPCRVKVSNILKRLKAEEMQELFEDHVGPVLHCVITEDTARVLFESQQSAQKAVEIYDGGVLEVASSKRQEESGPSQSSLFLHPRSTDSSWVEERVGPLTKCYLRRGEGWVTIFRAAITKQLKKD